MAAVSTASMAYRELSGVSGGDGGWLSKKFLSLEAVRADFLQEVAAVPNETGLVFEVV